MAEQEKVTPTPEEESARENTQDSGETAEENVKKASKRFDGKVSRAEKNLEKKIAEAEQRVADAEQRVAEVNDRLMRTAAEYDNHRKRSQREQESAFNNGVGYAAQELLPVLDALDCAARAETTDEEYKKGVMMTLTKCEEVFGKLGIKEIEAEGQPFDPEYHNAVMQQGAEGVESGTITQVVQKGYTLKDKVIRHAMVAVAP